MAKYSSQDIRMKKYEKAYRRYLDPQDYILLRLDGRAFHSFTRGLGRPFDPDLTHTMIATTKALCEQVQGVRAAYTQSDEISLLITAWKDSDADISKLNLAFGGVEAKLLSLTASIATVEFNQIWQNDFGSHSKLAHFDSRLWTFPGTEEGQSLVYDYLDWRRNDAIRNSISMVAQSHYSAKQLHGKNSSDMLNMIQEAGDSWADYHPQYLFGTTFHKVTHPTITRYRDKRTGEVKEVEVARSAWDYDHSDSYLNFVVPDPLNHYTSTVLGDWEERLLQ